MQERVSEWAILRQQAGRLSQDQLEQGAAGDHLLGWRSACAELLEARELIEALCKAAAWNYSGSDLFPPGSLIGGPTTNDAMRYLASIDRLKIESDDGVRMVGRLKP